MSEFPVSQPMRRPSPLFAPVVGRLDAVGEPRLEGRLVGVAGCRPGDGATYVARGLAKNMARSGKRVLFADGAHLQQALVAQPQDLLSLCVFTDQMGLFHLEKPKRRHAPARGTTAFAQALEPVWRQIDCVVMDLGAATVSGELPRFAPELDDLLLVVAAGETRRSQIAYAQKVIAHAGGRLTGCVLNKRTYPVPAAVYRALR